MLCMAYTFLVFEFGGSEQIAQQARHKVDGWKQGFRLDKKLQLKFDRKETEENSGASTGATAKAKPGSKKKSKSGGEAEQDSASKSAASEIRMIVRLDFSYHEKLSHQRWLERIPGEEMFKAAKPKIVRAGDPEFETTSKLFDSLD